MILPGVIASMGGGGPPPPYHADGVVLDGASWWAIDSLTGVVDSPLISSSHWVAISAYPVNPAALYDFDPANAEAPAVYIVGSGGGFSGLSGAILITASDGVVNLAWVTDAGVVPADGLQHNVLVCEDFINSDPSLQIVRVWVDDVEVTVSQRGVHAPGSIILKMAATKFAVPDTTEDFPTLLIGNLWPVWVAPGTFVDFSVEANRRKFINADLTPTNPNGYPTSAVLLNGNSTAWGQPNLGTGGAGTITGTLTNAPPIP